MPATVTQLEPAADYFAVFDLPRKLHLDLAQLERRFYGLSRKFHPDVYATKSPEEQQWSLDQTSFLNDAYRTLKNPVTRTEYLLRLEGVVFEAAKREDGAPKDSRIPPDMLEEVFELNMQLEEMRMGKKMGERDEQVAKDLEAAKERFEQMLASSNDDLQKFWTEWDEVIASGADAEDPLRVSVRDKMVGLLNRRSYVRNLVRDVNEALEE